MTEFKTLCPHCRTELRVPTVPPAGARLRCPKCQQAFAVPGAAAPTGAEGAEAEPRRRKKIGKRRKVKESSLPYGPLLLGAAGLGLFATVGVLFWVFVLGRQPPPPQVAPVDAGPRAGATLPPAGAAPDPAPAEPPAAPGAAQAPALDAPKLLLGAWEEADGTAVPGQLDFLVEGGTGGVHADPLGGLGKLFPPLKVLADFNLKPPYLVMTYRLASPNTLEFTYVFRMPPGVDLPRPASPETLAFAVSEKQLVLSNGRGDKITFRRPGLQAVAQLVDTLKGVRADCVAFSPDGQTLAVGGSFPSPTLNNLPEAIVQLWDVSGRKERARWLLHPRQEPPKGSYVPANQVVELSFCQDGKVLVTRESVSGISCWDAATGKQLYAVPERGVLVSPDGKVLAGLPDEKEANPKRGVVLRNAATGAELIRLAWERPEKLRALAFAPDGHHLAGLGDGGIGVVWDLAARKPLTQLPPDKPIPPPGLLLGMDSKPFAVAFSPDGKLLATVSEGVTLWDVGTKTRVYQDDGPPLPQALLFSPNGSWLVVRSGSTAPALYSLARQGDQVAVTKRADTHRVPGMVYPLGFSPDGKVLFVQPLHRNALSKLQALPTTTWRPRTTFLGRGVVLAPDGQHLAVVGGSEYHHVDLWRLTEPLGE
jgi:predicted Zn finger-like uncharacterized protein